MRRLTSILVITGGVLAVAVSLGALTAGAENLYVSLDGNETITRINEAGQASHLADVAGYPSGIAITREGTLFIASYSVGKIVLVTRDGEVSDFVALPIPYALVFDDNGTLYSSHLGTTSNSNYDTISKISPDGTISTFAVGFSAPSGMAFGDDGYMYVANRDSGTISKVAPNGTVSEFATGLNLPNGLAFGTNGLLYVADWGTDSVVSIDSLGNITTFLTDGLTNPLDIVSDGAGNFFVSNYDGASITKITSDGSGSIFTSGIDSPSFMAVYPTSDPSVPMLDFPGLGVLSVLLGALGAWLGISYQNDRGFTSTPRTRWVEPECKRRTQVLPTP
jgi:sugar lactone lactonase YvrE